MMDLYTILLENFPDIVREEATARTLLNDPENHIIEKYEEDALIGVSVIHMALINSSRNMVIVMHGVTAAALI